MVGPIRVVICLPRVVVILGRGCRQREMIVINSRKRRQWPYLCQDTVEPAQRPLRHGGHVGDAVASPRGMAVGSERAWLSSDVETPHA